MYEEVKPFLQSKTVWSLLVALIAMLIANTPVGSAMAGSEAQGQIVDAIMQVVAAVFTILGIVFRASATKRLN